MTPERINFGSRLRDQREARQLSLAALARVTKIPERSLERLEEGRFDELPGDVFVRGFLRSYARSVGMDPEDTVRRYGELARGGKPEAPTALAAGTRPPVIGEGAAPARGTPTQEVSLIAKALADAGRGTRRVSLTLAVIILVIVATLTLSLLLRRPSRTGDGLSRAGETSATSDA